MPGAASVLVLLMCSRGEGITGDSQRQLLKARVVAQGSAQKYLHVRTFMISFTCSAWRLRLQGASERGAGRFYIMPSAFICMRRRGLACWNSR